MRGRTTTVVLLAATLTACSHVLVPRVTPDVLQMRPVDYPSSPSPLIEVQVGDVSGVVPRGWDARLLPAGDLAQQGFEASPRIDDWDRGVAAVPGLEVFWIDISKLGIPSEYYYLAARSVSFGEATDGNRCVAKRPHVVTDNPPDFTGRRPSSSDFVAKSYGTCVGPDGLPARWGYVVAAPGYGPIRSLGIPSSGLYVVMAEVSGPHAQALLQEMLSKASFGDTTLPQILSAATREQRH